MSWCSDAPEDEAISLFAGLLVNPDMTLSHITILLFSRANRGGTCALINACAGGLDLWRIVSLELPSGFLDGTCGLSNTCAGGLVQLPYGHPELVGPLFQSSSLGDPQNKCSKRHATTSNVVQSQEKLVRK